MTDTYFIRKGAGTYIEYEAPGSGGKCAPLYMDRNSLQRDEPGERWIERQPDGFVLIYSDVSGDDGASAISASSAPSSSGGGSASSGGSGSASGGESGSSGMSGSSGGSSGNPPSVEYWKCEQDDPSGSGTFSGGSSGVSSSASSSSSSSSFSSSIVQVRRELGYVRNLLPSAYSVPFMGMPIDILGAEMRAGQPMVCSIDQEVFCGPAQPVFGTYEPRAAMVAPSYSATGIPNGLDRASLHVHRLLHGYRLRSEEMGSNCGAAPGTASVNISNGNLVLSIALPCGGPLDPPIRFFYYSLAALDVSPFGRGWSCLYDQWIEISSEPFVPQALLKRMEHPSGVAWNISWEQWEENRFRLQRIELDPAVGSVGTVDFMYIAGGVNISNRVGTTLFGIAGELLAGFRTAGKLTTFNYHPETLQLSRWRAPADSGQAVTEFEYDSSSLLLQGIRSPEGRHTRYEYPSESTRVVRNALNYPTTLTLDTEGNIAQAVEPVSSGQSITTTYTWDGRQRLLTATNGRGNTTTFTYATMDTFTRSLATVSQPVGTMTFTYSTSTSQLTRIDDQEDNGITIQWRSSPSSPYQISKYLNGESDEYNYVYHNISKFLASVTDPEGVATAWTYDGNLSRRTTTDGATNAVTFDYDEAGRLTRVEDARSAVTTIVRDPANRVTRIIDANSETTQFFYDSQSRLRDIAEAGGGVWRRYYDWDGWLIGERGPYPWLALKIYQYDGAGNITTLVDENRHGTLNTFDRVNRLISTKNPEDEITTFTYDAADNQVSITNPRNKSWSYSYDNNERLVSRTDLLIHTTSFEYDAIGNLTTMTDGAGVVTAYAYNALNLLQSENSAGVTTSYDYDDAERLVAVVRGSGSEIETTTYTYDSAGRVQTVEPRPTSKTTYTYDANGRIESITDPESNTGTMTYDAGGRLSTSVDALGRVTTHVYGFTGPQGQTLRRTIEVHAPIVSATSYARVTTMIYDPRGDLERVIANGTSGQLSPNSKSYVYDNAGRLRFEFPGIVSQVSGRRTEHRYDKAGRLVSSLRPEGMALHFDYDSAGRRIRMRNANNGGETVTFDYDDADRLVKVTTAENRTTEVGYDDADRQIVVEDGNNNKTTYVYDGLGRLQNEQNALPEVITYTYYATGRLKNIVSPLPLSLTRTVTYVYDGSGNLTVGIDARNEATTYTYLKNDLLSSVQDQVGNRVSYYYYANGLRKNERRHVGLSFQDTMYTYDELDRLVSLAVPASGISTYQYDDHWDEVSHSTNSRGYTTIYDYDDYGNLERIRQPVSSGVESIREFQYDLASVLTS